MKRSHILLFTANAYRTGLLVPVLSLVLLSRGATMETLSICIGIFALMVVILELPSGILADLIGRKRIFLISALLMTATYFLLLFSRQFFMLAAACTMQGIGRAFSSGSIEALEIEEYMSSHGTKGLEKINSTLTIIESIGLALGSITGGLLGFVDRTYSVLLVSAMILQLFILAMTIHFVKEPAPRQNTSPPFIQLKKLLLEIGSSLKSCRRITSIIFMAFAVGILLCTVEIYWQPAFKILLPDQLGWMFGLISCLGFIGISIGSKLCEYFINHRKKRLSDKAGWLLYWLLRFLLVFFAGALGFTSRIWLFVLLYILTYASLGAGNLMENTAFHILVSNEQRASMISLLSLSSRGGGLVTSVLGGLIVSGLSVHAVWIFLPGIAALLTGGIMFFFYRENNTALRTD